MRIAPLAADSMGARSMATFVETDDCNFLIDPNVRLAPERFGLPPHPSERKRRAELWRIIRNAAKRAKVLIVSHYHYDHHNPDAPSIYRGKIAVLKDYENKTNVNQGKRGHAFAKRIQKYAKEVLIADGEEYRFGGTCVKFSHPVVHGTDDRMGYVVETCIREKEAFVHTSDIVGGSEQDQVDFIVDQSPRTVLMDGPLTYMMGTYGKRNMMRSQSNMVFVLEEAGLRTLILDHHLLRERKWRERIPDVFDAANENEVKLLTCAGYLGRRDDLLEANRKELHGKHGR